MVEDHASVSTLRGYLPVRGVQLNVSLMAMTTVSWRRATAVLAATVLAIVALVVVLRADGLPATDATSSRAVRWVAHRSSGTAVLVDGFGGSAIARVPVGEPDDALTVVEGRNECIRRQRVEWRGACELDTAGIDEGPNLGSASGPQRAAARCCGSGRARARRQWLGEGRR